MIKFRQISGKELVKALQKLGFVVRRQKGSHVILIHETEASKRCTIPVHGNKPLKPGTLNAILKGVELSMADILRVM